ncbi:hypothetical protein POM88_042023 [Heracleum sosnowskyi]|uniref:Fungal lipase-type domain-containing protein n=1 Tax=Heracleum sosnowskyi TaxID=360622 RepID=A0AAD8HHY3_9APIA|nr:hypothetical protein POM88_042023 [Heracleum sosnowskyi]
MLQTHRRKIVIDVFYGHLRLLFGYAFCSASEAIGRQNPPRYVIAIRRTEPNASSHKGRGFQIVTQAVKEMVSVAGAANIWLAGHSSGAAIALLAGQNMVELDNTLTCF